MADAGEKTVRRQLSVVRPIIFESHLSGVAKKEKMMLDARWQMSDAG